MCVCEREREYIYVHIYKHPYIYNVICTCHAACIRVAALARAQIKQAIRVETLAEGEACQNLSRCLLCQARKSRIPLVFQGGVVTLWVSRGELRVAGGCSGSWSCGSSSSSSSSSSSYSRLTLITQSALELQQPAAQVSLRQRKSCHSRILRPHTPVV